MAGVADEVEEEEGELIEAHGTCFVTNAVVRGVGFYECVLALRLDVHAPVLGIGQIRVRLI